MVTMAAVDMAGRRSTPFVSLLAALLLTIAAPGLASAQDGAAAPAPADTPAAPADTPAAPADTPAAPAVAAPEATPQPPQADEPPRHSALSLIGDPKFGPDFKHFDWVNPDAPKGGVVRFTVEGTFDSLNPFSVQGVPAAGASSIYDSLMTGSPDEESTEYGLIAEWVSYPPDIAWAKFGLRPEARFHDGTPITPEDVIFSLEALKKADPMRGRYYKNEVRSGKNGDHEVQFTFD